MTSVTQLQITYLFVDGSNFRKYFNENTEKWFGQEIEFDFKKIKDFFKAEKAFYYDCIDDIKSDKESQNDYEERVKLQEEKLNKIREVEGSHVHLGSLAGIGKKKRQKEVDVLLSVQMMEHAFRGNMKKAVLLSGDKDFRPLVESLVRLGLFVEVVGDQKHISKDLIHSADAHRQLTIDEYFNFSPEAIQQTKPIDFLTLSFFIERAASEGFFQSREGTWQNSSIFLFASNSRTGNWFTTSNKLIHNDSAWVSNDLKKLISYFELKFGQINWK